MLKKFLYIHLFLGLMMGCATLPPNTNRKESHALPPDPTTRLGDAIDKQLKDHPGQSAFYPLSSGLEAFIARMASVAVADRTVDLQYYIWENDLTGRLMLHSALTAADRGVRVRILLDDLNQARYEKMLVILDSHPNIEVRMANPFASRSWKIFDIVRFSTVNRRMHNKVFIVDNQTGIVGGRNIGNEYFDASAEMNFGDFDLWTFGPVVQSLSQEFDTYWNSEIAYPITALNSFQPTSADLDLLRQDVAAAVQEAEDTRYAEALQDTPIVRQFTKEPLKLFWGKAEVIIDPPAKLSKVEDVKEEHLPYQLFPLIAETQKELLLVSPYFIPGKKGVNFFGSLHERGVQAVILTNSLASSDVATVFSGYKGYRKDLLKNGAKLFELKPTPSGKKSKKKKIVGSFSSSGLHGKVFIFDRKKVFVGSMNLDPRSVTLNSEMGVVVESPEFAKAVAERFMEDLSEDSYEVVLSGSKKLEWKTREGNQEHTYFSDPETTWWKRFKAAISAIFIPESWL
ncbi:phospholipase D family protein [Bdellovibrio sp.]|uniref:phospholipase D family protein n=1 Tax=Bdellovibrio sp. TaxID=28201 RepID=UPI0032217A70